MGAKFLHWNPSPAVGITDEGWDFSPACTKILMLTHNVLAAEQGYPTIAKTFNRNEAFAKKEDKLIEFLADTLEPMCQAYEGGRYGEMFRIIGGMQTIRSHANKKVWRKGHGHFGGFESQWDDWRGSRSPETDPPTEAF
jgi:hypothetical protein